MGILLGGSQENVPIVENIYIWEETGFVKFAVSECDAWNCGNHCEELSWHVEIAEPQDRKNWVDNVANSMWS